MHVFYSSCRFSSLLHTISVHICTFCHIIYYFYICAEKISKLYYMDRFVSLTLYDTSRGEEVERWFNVRAIRHFEPSRNEVQLYGSMSPMKVTTESMERLVRMVSESSEFAHASYMNALYYYSLVSKLAAKDVGRKIGRASLWSRIKRFFCRK